MATSKQVKAWVEQAKTNPLASKVTTIGIGECHRRYWIQQAYEKANFFARAPSRTQPEPTEEP
jgi:hypothetical protein